MRRLWAVLCALLFAPGCVRSIALYAAGFQNVKTPTGLAFREDEVITSEAHRPAVGADGRTGGGSEIRKDPLRQLH